MIFDEPPGNFNTYRNPEPISNKPVVPPLTFSQQDEAVAILTAVVDEGMPTSNEGATFHSCAACGNGLAQDKPLSGRPGYNWTDTHATDCWYVRVVLFLEGLDA